MVVIMLVGVFVVDILLIGEIFLGVIIVVFIYDCWVVVGWIKIEFSEEFDVLKRKRGVVFVNFYVVLLEVGYLYIGGFFWFLKIFILKGKIIGVLMSVWSVLVYERVYVLFVDIIVRFVYVNFVVFF